MLSVLIKIVGGLLLAVMLVCAFGWVRAFAASKPPLRGELVDIGGGRRLRIVCEGPRSDRPLIVTESGIFGFAADWGAVQTALTAEGIRSCAYDRAGLGFSDRGPQPRDGLAVVTDLEALLAARGETGPLILVGHSMAGLHATLFALRNPSRVKGLVLIDALTPEIAETESGKARLKQFSQFAGHVETMATLGVLSAIAPWQGDSIGLSGPARAEKIWFFGDRAFNPAAAEETRAAGRAAEQAMAAGRLSPDLPVAVITEGSRGRPGAPMRPGRMLAAERSRHGFYETVEGATHASLLGQTHAGAIVRAVKNVMAAAAGEPAPYPDLALPPQTPKGQP